MPTLAAGPISKKAIYSDTYGTYEAHFLHQTVHFAASFQVLT